MPRFRPDQQELKFLVDGPTARALWQAAVARLGPAPRPLYVRTTYYDTPDYRLYRSARGPVARRVRVREYARTAGPGRRRTQLCYLEFKQSASGLRSKLRLPLRPEDVRDRLAHFEDGPFEPCVMTHYRRAALVDADDNVRITLDDEIQFCAPSEIGASFGPGSGGEVLGSGPEFVLEVKLAGPLPAWLCGELDGLTEAVWFSKFTAAMRAAACRGLIRVGPTYGEKASA